MSGYVDSGYWVSGFAIGDQELPHTVNANTYTAYLGENACFCPMQAYSIHQITYMVSPPLPSGLSLDPSTGLLQGAPDVLSAPQEYSMMALDATFASVSVIFSLQVDKSSKTIAGIDVRSIAQSRIALQYRAR